MSLQARGHVYRRNGVNSNDDYYQVDNYYANLYDELADGGYQEHGDDGDEAYARGNNPPCDDAPAKDASGNNSCGNDP